ncbi:hypothetical protein [Kineococcus radiotolerans]|uniref:hypothetical protein n=1 Tax=Kineococcus radiotolerans TaxID=131568 RepID=UPI00138AEECF|nr:hypothetical protein [Kineococcus radiotolerans]
MTTVARADVVHVRVVGEGGLCGGGVVLVPWVGHDFSLGEFSEGAVASRLGRRTGTWPVLELVPERVLDERLLDVVSG